MKYLYLILAMTLLASCWVESKNQIETATVDEVVELTEIEDNLSTLDNLVENNSKTEKLSTVYDNDKVSVEMDVEYTLDSEWKISAINISASNYDLTDFNTNAQGVLLGLSLDEASEVTAISGSSLTTAAFTKLLKEAK